MKREIIKASSEHEKEFRANWKLREEVKDNLYWVTAYEHAAQYKLYSNEIAALAPFLERKDNG